MAVVLTILIGLLALVLCIVLAALIAPLRIELRATFNGARTFTLALRPFGRFGPRLALPNKDRKPRKKRPKAAAKPGKRRSRKPMRSDRFRRAMPRLIGDIIGCFHLHSATLDLQFGLGDPAETGQMFGAIAPLVYGTGHLSNVDIAIQPHFDRAVLAGHAGLDITLRPVSLLPPALRFGWAAFGPAR